MGQAEDSGFDRATVELFNGLRKDYCKVSETNNQILQRLAALDQKTVDMKDDVESLCQLVRDGNGQPSIAQRLTTLEQKTASQHSWLEEVATNCTTIAAARTLSRSQVIAGLVVMIVTAALSVIALVAEVS